MDYINCSKCGHRMEIHYEWFCPKCDTDILKRKSILVGDLFKIMYHMQANGYMPKDMYWRAHVKESYPQLGNDMYLDMYFNTRGNNEEINRYHKKVLELMGLTEEDDEEPVTMWISW